jgi:hypothetical protein
LKPELTFTFFFLFFSCITKHFRYCSSFAVVLMEAAIKHPQAPQGAIKSGAPFSFRGKELFYADEERSGGVAAIE